MFAREIWPVLKNICRTICRVALSTGSAFADRENKLQTFCSLCVFVYGSIDFKSCFSLFVCFLIKGYLFA